MIRYPPPPAPPTFPTPAIEAAKKALEASSGSTPIPDLWRPYKADFQRIQSNKCGWCEAKQLGHPGTLEHYAPKAEVGELMEPGAERDGLVNVQGRRVQTLYDVGYWWLAYDWDNWFFACERCNTVWKQTLFPVKEQPHPRPDPNVPYHPLLLHPFRGEDPFDHLDFDDLGQVKPRNGSAYGRATIDTLGLDREALRSERQEAIKRACSLKQLIESSADYTEEEVEEIWRQVGEAVSDSKAFAAVVRNYVQRELDVSWTHLADLPKKEVKT